MRQFLLVALITLPVLARAGKARCNISTSTAIKVSRRQEFIFVIVQPFDIRFPQTQDSEERRSQLPADARPGTEQTKSIQAFQAQQKKQSMSDRSFSPESAKVLEYRSHSRVDQDGRCASLQTAPSSAHGEGATLLEAPGDHQSVPRHLRRKMHLGAGRKRQARGGIQIGRQMRLLQRREVRKNDMETTRQSGDSLPVAAAAERSARGPSNHRDPRRRGHERGLPRTPEASAAPAQSLETETQAARQVQQRQRLEAEKDVRIQTVGSRRSESHSAGDGFLSFHAMISVQISRHAGQSHRIGRQQHHRGRPATVQCTQL